MGASYSASITETLTSANDTLRRAVTGFRSMTEITDTSDSPTRTLGVTRPVVDYATRNGQLVSPMLLFTFGAPSAAFDTVTRKVGYGRKEIDTYISTDALARQFNNHQVIVESIPSTDALATQQGYVRNFTDTLTTGDAIQRFVQAKRGFSEWLTRFTGMPLLFMTPLQDVLTRVVGFGRGNTQSLTTSDSLVRRDAFGRINAETLTTGDVLTRRAVIVRGFAETLTTLDVFSRQANFRRVLFEWYPSADLLARHTGTGRTTIETSPIGRASPFLLFTSPIVGSFDVLTTSAASHPRVIIEPLTTLDALTTIKLLWPVMGYVITDPQLNVTGFDLPDWGFILTEDPTAGIMMHRAPISPFEVNQIREK